MTELRDQLKLYMAYVAEFDNQAMKIMAGHPRIVTGDVERLLKPPTFVQWQEQQDRERIAKALEILAWESASYEAKRQVSSAD